VRMPIDNGVLGAGDLRLGGVEHALRLVLVDGELAGGRVLRARGSRKEGGGDCAETLAAVQVTGHGYMIRGQPVSKNAADCQLTVRFRTAPFRDRTETFLTLHARELKRPRFTSPEQTYAAILRLCE